MILGYDAFCFYIRNVILDGENSCKSCKEKRVTEECRLSNPTTNNV